VQQETGAKGQIKWNSWYRYHIFAGIPKCTVINMGICAIQAHVYAPLLSNSNREKNQPKKLLLLARFINLETSVGREKDVQDIGVHREF